MHLDDEQRAEKLNEELKTLTEQVRRDKRKEYRELKQQAAIDQYLEDGSNKEFIQEWNYHIQMAEEYASESDIQRKFSQLCSELKFLYVAITRPRNRLFIYDEDSQNRAPLDKIWRRIDAV